VRYYNLSILDPNTDEVKAQYTSVVNGASIPSALQVEFDIPVTYFSQPISQALIRVHGIGIDAIKQGSNFNKMNCVFYGGMKKGLPLANPTQSGLLVSGTIFQCFGNWVGTDQVLNIILTSNGGTDDQPKNIVFNWLAGEPMANPISNALTTAFPEYGTPQISISDKLVRQTDEPAFNSTLAEFARHINEDSKAIITDANYSGVQMYLNQNNQFVVYDSLATSATPGGSTLSSPKVIAFTDLIGQPTWFAPNQITFDCVLRADIGIGDFIQMPKTPTTVLAQAHPEAQDTSIFQGTFQISFMRHIGNYRQPSGDSWVTTFQAFQTGTSTS
jgi:hypothetical protein